MFWLINFIIRIWTRITCRMDAEELKKVPAHGPLIAIANHTGQIEVPLIFAHLQPRPVTGWAKVEAWDNKFLNWVFDVWGLIPVRRGEADMKALKDALKALEQGKILGIAPEGTRNKTGRLIRALPGTVMVALHSGAPIIPVAHWGGEDYLKNLKRLRRTDFHVRVGRPFIINTEGIKVNAEVRQQIVDEMMYRLAELLPEEYRGEYSDLTQAHDKFLRSIPEEE
jgi:1-acyl-sn-glycerol-3-phosphate acyltransferase